MNIIHSFQQENHTKESLYPPPNAIPGSHPQKKKNNKSTLVQRQQKKKLKPFKLAIHKLYQPFSSSIHLSNTASNNSEERTSFPLSNAIALPKTTEFAKQYGEFTKSQKPFFTNAKSQALSTAFVKASNFLA